MLPSTGLNVQCGSEEKLLPGNAEGEIPLILRQQVSVPLMLLCDDFSDLCGYLKFQISKLLQSGRFYLAHCSNLSWLLIFTLPKIHVCDSKK